MQLVLLELSRLASVFDLTAKTKLNQQPASHTSGSHWCATGGITSSRHSGVRVCGAMAGGDLLVDRLVAGGFLRPAVLLRGLQLRRPALSCWRVGLLMGLSGLLCLLYTSPSPRDRSLSRMPSSA